jgi:transcriptional regulator with XRE-family HTH domain
MSGDFEKLQAVLSGNVRRLRRERNLTQEELAFEAEIDRTYVSQLERCVNNPSLLVLSKIAGALGADVVTLLKASKG